MKKIIISPLLFFFLVATLFVTSCKDDDKETVVSADTKLLTFKIMNADVNEDVVCEGIINDADKKVEVRVPFETSLKALKYEATAAEGVRIVPTNNTVLDYTSGQKIVTVSGLNNTIYQIDIVKQAPTTPTVMDIKLVNASGTHYPTEIDYKAKKIKTKVLTGFPTLVKAEILQIGPSGATYTISNVDDDGFFDLKETPQLTVTSGGSSKTFQIDHEFIPFGADFTKPTTVELSQLKSAVPLVLSGGNNRDGHMGGGAIFVPTRYNGNFIYYWETSKLFANNHAASKLNTEGMDFGDVTWGVSSVYVVGEKVYLASMTNAKDKLLKVWYWANKTAKPQLVLSYTIPAPTAPAVAVRLGDCFSVALDAQGKGKMFFSNFPFQNPNNQFYVFDINNFTEMNESPSIFNLNLGGTNVGQYGRVNSIPEESDLYTVTGSEMGIAVIDAMGDIKHMISADVIQGRAQDARIINFNGARYLIYTVNREWEKGGVFGEAIEISEGNNTLEALKLLTASNVESRKLYKLPLVGLDLNDAWVSATSSAEVINDQLYIMHFSTLGGFAVQRFNKN